VEKKIKTILKTILIFISLMFPKFHDHLSAQVVGQNYALLIGGLGGENKYSERFYQFLMDSRKAFIENFQFSQDRVIVLAETRFQEDALVDDVSTAENIQARLLDFSIRITENDDLFIILFGHGNYDGQHAKLNIPRRDLNEDDYAEWVDPIRANRIVFINTASSSFPFIKAISGLSRVVITSTNRPTQRNITVFPEYFVEALTDPGADLDKNGNLSVLEVFRYASQKTGRFYSDNNHLATEFAMLEDTGDQRAFRESELAENGEGALAGITYLKRQYQIVTSDGTAKQDSVFTRLVWEKEQVELEIAKLKTQKTQYTEQAYYEKLEVLLIRLAHINDRIEWKKDQEQF